ncbi:hypothetical protein RYX36_023128, partial [Vicia faba]
TTLSNLLPILNLPPSPNPETDNVAEGDSKRDIEEEITVIGEIVQNPWNLKPRKPMLSRGAFKIRTGTGGSKNNSREFQEAVNERENLAPKSLRLRGFADTEYAEKREKRKF